MGRSNQKCSSVRPVIPPYTRERIGNVISPSPICQQGKRRFNRIFLIRHHRQSCFWRCHTVNSAYPSRIGTPDRALVHEGRTTGPHVSSRVVRGRPMSWPPDSQNAYALWLEPPESPGGGSRAYVTAHPVYRDIGVHSRFAVRLDLPGVYLDKSAAAADAFAIARRYFHGRYSPLPVESAKTLKGYRITAHARFRIDSHQWEPILSIRSGRQDNKGAVQTFDGGDSPFVHRTFPTAPTAANYGLAYGERIVLGLVNGLRV